MILSCLTYVSHALIPQDGPEIAALMEEARRLNAARDITGVLYFDGAMFFQALEGEETALVTLYDVIRHDPRHHKVRLLSLTPLPRRRFTDWSMKLVSPPALPPEAPRAIRRAVGRPGSAGSHAAIDALI